MVLTKNELVKYAIGGILMGGITPNILSAITLQNPFYYHVGLLFTALGLPAFILSFYDKKSEGNDLNGTRKTISHSNKVRC